MLKKLSEMNIEELWELFPIYLTKHQNHWKEWYKEEEKILNSVFPKEQVMRISHIGSTAIDKIWAKPIIDILLECPKDSDINNIKEILTQNGYICMSQSENKISLNKGYTEYGFAEKVFHIHLRYMGDNNELYFRDYLNEHSYVAQEYEQLKLSLWKEYEHNRDGYTDAKTEFVSKYSKQARLEYGAKYED
ncbi:GrpB-like predicted nucleotidyltransferase (UPF0157 family) [Lachnotalea glycerini]|uniref:GrpB-like predicted nucleotidyltransferase (UPF0157 family) n=1 Tax=Lachnotalea glycerini TaxID=1763509 RepID=A0A318ERM3_9FIRM|nr:GrpB family protein [Lachnotalea glycerini]OYO51110.1 hypothetical protein CG709_20085 [Lachnotalea glycerini]PXV93626.1 GrpB-like predicted nucleotidyltransferase (UPF0157 family) [Lachnotalea glycerini]